MSVLGAIVEWEQLGEVVAASFAAGVGVSAIFGVAIHGITRSIDSARDNRGVAATAYAALAVIAFLAVTSAIVFGVAIMVTK